MRIISAIWVMAVLSTMSSTPVHATLNYSYKKHEYPVISAGRAPNHRLAIAAHGEGEFGYENFHLYLMAGRKIIRSLPAIEEGDILDTGAKAFNAAWSPDSRRVIVRYRSNRHIVEFRFYDIRGHHVRRIPTSDPVERFVKRSETDPHDLRWRSIEISWLSSTRFRLEQRSVYVVPSRALANALGTLGQTEVDSKQPPTTDSDGNPITWFRVNASLNVIYDIRGGSRPRIVSIKSGKFDEPKFHGENKKAGPSGVDLTFATRLQQTGKANVKSKTPLTTNIC